MCIRDRTGSECTSHYIRKNVLLDLVLEDMRRVLRYVKEHEQDFICKATEYGDMEARKALAQQQKELFKAQARMTELDTLFRKPFLDFAHTHAANKHSENLFDNRRGLDVYKRQEHGYPIILSHAAFGRLRLSAAPQHSYDL